MSLEKDMVNAELMLAKLKKMAKREGLSMHKYILKNGENIYDFKLYMKTMEFMTFYTTNSWGRVDIIVMVLGLYLNSEIDSMIKKEPLLIGKVVGKRSSHRGAVYISAGGSDSDSKLFSVTTASDGWGRHSHVVKHQIHLNKPLINWIYRDPLEVKE